MSFNVPLSYENEEIIPLSNASLKTALSFSTERYNESDSILSASS